MHKETQKILVAGPAWVGDMVMAQSLFISLKQRPHPVEIDVLAPAWSNPILARMPEVNNIINLPLNHGELGLMQRYKLGKTLRVKQYAQAIITPRSFKAALVPFFAKAKQRTGYLGEMRYALLNDIRMLDKSVLQQTVQRYVALAQESDVTTAPAVPFPKLSVDQNNLQRLLKDYNLSLEHPVVALLPGAEYGEAKRWPVAYYAELANTLEKQGIQVWILGSEKDRTSATLIAKDNAAINLCGLTKLEDSIDLLSVCNSAVSNDSGLMHIAAALDIPLVAIYGSSTPAYTPPLTHKAKIQYLGLECSPCFKRECPLQHTNCLNEIKPEAIVETVLKQIK